jgi:chaperonin GroES
LVPLFDRILVQRLKPQRTTSSGVVLPDSAQDKVNEAKVLAVGPGRRLDDGSFVVPQLKVGDKVVLPEYGGNQIKLDGQEFVIVDEASIIAKFE